MPLQDHLLVHCLLVFLTPCSLSWCLSSGDKAFTSWWAVKLGRNQKMNKIWNSRYLDQLDYPTQYEFIAAIFRMGLLKKVQARDWSRSGPQSLNHDPLEQSSIRLCHGTKTHYLGVATRLSIKNPCLLSQHPFGESTILLFVKGSLVKTVSAFSGTALVTAQLSKLWTGKKKMISELIRLSFLCFSLVMEVLDLSRLDISIWTWEWNSSW